MRRDLYSVTCVFVARCFVKCRGSCFHLLTRVLPSSNDRGSYTAVARSAMHQSCARPYVTVGVWGGWGPRFQYLARELSI
jgi:hypothetical protein